MYEYHQKWEIIGSYEGSLSSFYISSLPSAYLPPSYLYQYSSTVNYIGQVVRSVSKSRFHLSLRNISYALDSAELDTFVIFSHSATLSVVSLMSKHPSALDCHACLLTGSCKNKHNFRVINLLYRFNKIENTVHCTYLICDLTN